MSQFAFLEEAFPEQFELVQRAERYALDDPGACGLYARKTLESFVKWMFEFDRSLPVPFDTKLNDYLHVPEFKALRGGSIFDKARKIQRIGNRAAHEAKPPSKPEAVDAVQSLYLISWWVANTYKGLQPADGDKFRPQELPRPGNGERLSLKERQQLEDAIEREAEETAAARERAAALVKTNEELEAEIARLRSEVAASKAAAEKQPLDDAVLDESETRDYLIDLYLNEAGWPLDDERDREYPVTMPAGTKKSNGFVDYVLWGDDGLPLAVVEAKRTTVDARAGQQQGALYADALEAEFGRRPVVFYTNGYEHWIWDDHGDGYPPRRVFGFYTRDDLERIVRRRTAKKPLASLDINRDIAGRPYQERAIRSVAEALEAKNRKGLLVMATGSGKTRTVVALTHLLQRADWVKRVLFLADRQELVRQAVGAFKAHLPDIDPVNLLESPNEEGRVYVSTYQTMVGKIDERRATDGTQRFGPGHFDLVVIDEAHRSVYHKYRGIFEHFDSMLIGLTATPKEEIDRNTYGLFDLDTGFPTDAYSLEEAIEDGYLVPPRGVSVPLKFVREGIRYDDLSEEEKEALEESGWGDDDGDGLIDDGGDVPPDVTPGELNKFLFNEDTVDKALEHLMVNGIKVAGGDRLGKTIIFAKNQDHAQFIKERFDAQYPALDAGRFAQVVTHRMYDAQKAIVDFKKKESTPHIAISVDMLDTGIDVPEIVNLMIFKPVRSRAKFWQMLGRGTRLCEDLFAPGEDKAEFFVFDLCGTLEYFGENPEAAETGGGGSLSERLFATRVAIFDALEQVDDTGHDRAELAGLLRETVASMHPGNFLVRRHLRTVEKYSTAEAWSDPEGLADDKAVLMDEIASLPDQLPADAEDSKRFDMMVLNTQLAILDHEPWEPYRRRIVQICGLLEAQIAIPAVAEQLELLTAVQGDEWWTDVNYRMLEQMRRKVRALVPLLEKKKRGVVTTDIADVIGDAEVVDIVPVSSFTEFKKRAEGWLSEHLGDAVVAKVRSGEPLTVDDEAELQRLLIAGDVGDDANFAEAAEKAGSLALFVRSLIGLDRAACEARFADFLDDKRYTSKQIRFVQMLIDELTSAGTVQASRLYEQPYMGIAPEGPEQLFDTADTDRIFDAIKELEP